eukprot:5698923-Prymnesium_polylepis.1
MGAAWGSTGSCGGTWASRGLVWGVAPSSRLPVPRGGMAAAGRAPPRRSPASRQGASRAPAAPSQSQRRSARAASRA